MLETHIIYLTHKSGSSSATTAEEINPCFCVQRTKLLLSHRRPSEAFEEFFNITNLCFLFLYTSQAPSQTTLWRNLIDFAFPVIFNHHFCRLLRGWSQFSLVIWDLGCSTSVMDTTWVKINNKLNHSRQCDQWRVALCCEREKVCIL